MSDQPDWMGQRACQPAQLLWAGGMDVHDDCGNEGSPWRRCTAVWEGIGTVTELLMPWQREVASSVRSDGRRRAGQAFRAPAAPAAPAAATAATATSCKLTLLFTSVD